MLVSGSDVAPNGFTVLNLDEQIELESILVLKQVVEHFKELKLEEETKWSIELLKPKRHFPVPSDIDISRAQTPKPIDEVRVLKISLNVV